MHKYGDFYGILCYSAIGRDKAIFGIAKALGPVKVAGFHRGQVRVETSSRAAAVAAGLEGAAVLR